MLIQPKSKLLMIGDSITDCGRERPIAEGTGTLGNGYVSLVDGLLGAAYPGLGIRVVNMGVGGNTIRDLKARWQTDVLGLKPDWLSIMIGINDVWRRFGDEALRPDHVPQKEYEKTLEDLVRRTLPQLKGLILITPYYIEPDRADSMRAMMDRYGEVVKQLASKYRAVFVDAQAAFDLVLQDIPPATLSVDQVHPNLTGHMILARAVLKAIGYDW